MIGLDALCTEHDLDEHSRVALLAMSVCAISPTLAEEVFDRVSLHLTVTMPPETVTKILDISG